MGWTSVNWNGSVDEYFNNQFINGEVFEFVGKGYLVNMHEYYRAVHNKLTNQYFALIVLVQFNKDSYYNFSYKEMDESCGPCYNNCPKKVLDIIDKSEPSNEWAKQWREACRKVIEKKEKAKKVKNGTVIRFNVDIGFGNGAEANTFIVWKMGRKTIFSALNDNGSTMFKCRITKWQNYSFDILSEDCNAYITEVRNKAKQEFLKRWKEENVG